MTAEEPKSPPRGGNLEQLYAEHSGRVSAKWSGYLTEYERVLDEYRDRPVRLLELGIQNGGSLEIWSKYLPYAQQIVGCDINADCTRLSYDDLRIAVVIGDANANAARTTILEYASAFDIILDDGSHCSSDTVKSFSLYFPFLTDGGVYIIEDLHCSYWKAYEGGLYHPYSSIAFFKQLCDVINYEHWGVEKSRSEILYGFCTHYGFEIDDATLQHIHSVQFINSMCVIRRADPARCKLGRRVIAGSVATVAPGSLALQSRERVTPSQAANEWSVRDGTSEEKLRLVIAKFAECEAETREVLAKLSAREREIQELKNSTSWRITAPLRVICRGLAWLLRNGRRALILVWWLSTGQFGRAAQASLPYYRRLVPLRVKAMVPDWVRKALKRGLEINNIGLAEYTDRFLTTAVDHAEAASKAKDWPEAVARWLAVLDDFGDNEAASGRAKLNFSIARRLSNIDAYKTQIAKYTVARAAKISQSKESPKIAIYTAVIGGYDSIKLPEKLDYRFDYFLFTDSAIPDSGVWQIRPITYFHEDATRTARFVKTHPHLLLEDYNVAIWIDANIMIIGDIHPVVESFLASGKAVAAFPHPQRKSIYEEFKSCIQLKKDDPATLRQQIARYRRGGFDHDDLIESNLMMFDLGNQRINRFLDTWWAEIDCCSRRDQLSLNYALAKNGINWHRISERPNSVRNHPAFAFVPHDAGNGPASELIDALQIRLVDPYVGPSYAEVRDQRIAAQEQRRIDIVVCAHNALEELQYCLECVRRARNSEHHRLIIIDDGSGQPTAQYLEDFTRCGAWIELYCNSHAQGYTKAANQGLAASTGELVILLNSDTIVTDGWAEKMADAVFSIPGAGIVGPMSNAASHQSIPEHRGSKDQTAINDLPAGLTAEDMNLYCEQWTTAYVFPRTPLVHGFCFGIRREVIDRIGFFDADNFPNGYGEENDYCFRAADAGFGLVIATHTYIFHTKSKSYADHKRVALTKAGSKTLQRLHGRDRVQRGVRSMQDNPFLVNIRKRAQDLYRESHISGSNSSMLGVHGMAD